MKKVKSSESFENARIRGTELLKDFSDAFNFVRSRTGAIQENLAFYEGNQNLLTFYTDEEKPWVIQMTTPHAQLAVDTRVSSLIATNYLGTLQPYKPEHQETIKVLSRVYEDLWKAMEADDIVSDSIETAAVCREAYCHIIPCDKNSKTKSRNEIDLQLEAYLLDTSSVILDPNARKFEDCDYVYITGRMSKSKAISKYAILKGHEDAVVSSSTPEERGETNIGNDFTTSQDNIVLKRVKYVKEYEGKDFKIKRYTFIESYLVDETTLDGFKRFPIAQLRWRKASQSAYGLSLMDGVVQLQKAINSIESAVTNSAIAYSNPQYVIDSNSGLSPTDVALASGAPGAVFMVNGGASTAIKVLTPPIVDEKSILLKNQFENSIKEIAGLSGSFVGSIGTAGNTAEGASLAVSRSKIIETKVFKNIKDYVECMTRIIIDYITFHYSEGDSITLRKQGERGEIQFDQAIIPNLDDLQYSFYIDVDKKTPYAKEKEAKAIMDMFQVERQYDTPIKLINELDVLKSLGLENDEYLEQRYKKMLLGSNEQKAQTIQNLTDLQNTYQIPPELVQVAITEILDDTNDKKEAVTEVLSYAEQAAAQEEQVLQAEQMQQAEQMDLLQEPGFDIPQIG